MPIETHDLVQQPLLGRQIQTSRFLTNHFCREQSPRMIGELFSVLAFCSETIYLPRLAHFAARSTVSMTSAFMMRHTNTLKKIGF
jgi:hypothetical protein